MLFHTLWQSHNLLLYSFSVLLRFSVSILFHFICAIYDRFYLQLRYCFCGEYHDWNKFVWISWLTKYDSICVHSSGCFILLLCGSYALLYSVKSTWFYIPKWNFLSLFGIFLIDCAISMGKRLLSNLNRSPYVMTKVACTTLYTKLIQIVFFLEKCLDINAFESCCIVSSIRFNAKTQI